ncbi:hypothetical protein MMC22_011526 [Lobaria immixta]|nr:hypothetical protein [Lobaria immixta]
MVVLCESQTWSWRRISPQPGAVLGRFGDQTLRAGQADCYSYRSGRGSAERYAFARSDFLLLIRPGNYLTMHLQGIGPPGSRVIEDIAYFKDPGPSGAFISNLVSQGRDAADLYLTYYFEWRYPQIEDGSDEATKTSEKL